MKHLLLKELLEQLGYRDIRSVRKWCAKNGVFIVRQGKDEFVIESDFNKAFEIPFINNLKKNYGKDWEEVYRLHQEGNVIGLTALQTSVPVYRKTFKTENNIVSKYLNKYERDNKTKAA